MKVDCLPSPSLPVELLTVEEFADHFKVSRTTVFSWLKSGILREGVHYLRLGRILRFRWHSDLFFNSRPRPNPAEDAPSTTPLPATGTIDFQRGKATVNSKLLPYQRAGAPTVNIDY